MRYRQASNSSCFEGGLEAADPTVPTSIHTYEVHTYLPRSILYLTTGDEVLSRRGGNVSKQTSKQSRPSMRRDSTEPCRAGRA